MVIDCYDCFFDRLYFPPNVRNLVSSCVFFLQLQNKTFIILSMNQGLDDSVLKMFIDEVFDQYDYDRSGYLDVN